MAALRELDATGGLLSTLITQFLEDTPQRVAALDTALQQRDPQAVARVAHEVTGSSGNVGARRMRQICVELQALGNAKDLTKARDLLAQLVSEFAVVRPRLLAAQAAVAQNTLTKEGEGPAG